MYSDQTYELMFAYRQTKLWKELYDTDLFAVALPEGEIGYCSVMGNLGEHIALALFVGSKGLDGFRQFHEIATGRETQSGLKRTERMLSQSCLQCAFENRDMLSPPELEGVRRYAKEHKITFRGPNSFPQLVKYTPACGIRMVKDKTDEGLLCEALRATMAVSKKLESSPKDSLGFWEQPPFDCEIPLLTPQDGGFAWSMHQLPPPQPVSYPEPVLYDELMAARLQRMSKRSQKWVCDIVMSPTPTLEGVDGLDEDVDETELLKSIFVSDAPNLELSFPYIVFAVDCQTDRVMYTDPVFHYSENADELLHKFCSLMVENGVPRQIDVVDERTFLFLKSLAKLLHIKLELTEGNDFLDCIEDDFMNFCGISDFDTDMDDDDDDEGIEIFEEFILAMGQQELSHIPKKLWKQIVELDRQGYFSEKVSRKIRQLDKDR